MSQAGPPDADKRSRKRKLKHSRPLLEQLPSVPPSSDKQKQHKRQQPEQQQQQPEQDALSAGNSKFARALGSTDFHTREQGLQALSRWLTHKQLVSELDMLKLWKGIYFCFWHSDKEPVQEDLAERLAGLIPRMQPGMAVLYWGGMLATLRAEWFALDRHRLNKFLMLVRKFVAALFKRLAAQDWSVESIQGLTSNLPLVGDIIPTSSSSSSGSQAVQTTRSLGLSYHLADVWLPELRKVAGEGPLPPEGLAALLEPFVGVLQHSGEAALINRVRESVFEALVQDVAAAAAAAATVNASSSSDEDEDEEDVSDFSVWAYCAALDPAGYAALLFDRGAQQGVKSRNREALYGISKDLERVAGKKRKAGGGGGGGAGGAAGAGTAAGKQQLQHKQSNQERQQQQGEQEHSAHKKHRQQAAGKQQQQQQAQAEPVAANGHVANPPSAKKHKRQQQEAEVAAAAAAAAGTPGSSSGHKSSKQQKQQAAAAAAAGAGSVDGTPAAAARGCANSTAAAAAAAVASASAAKRGVKIDLKKNLYFEHGAPPPAADIRTPPKAKPKGSALKTAAVKLDERGRPASDGKQQQSGARRKLVTPSSVPRLRAAEFF